jgi:hypothetical protein
VTTTTPNQRLKKKPQGSGEHHPLEVVRKDDEASRKEYGAQPLGVRRNATR